MVVSMVVALVGLLADLKVDGMVGLKVDLLVAWKVVSKE